MDTNFVYLFYFYIGNNADVDDGYPGITPQNTWLMKSSRIPTGCKMIQSTPKSFITFFQLTFKLNSVLQWKANCQLCTGSSFQKNTKMSFEAAYFSRNHFKMELVHWRIDFPLRT